MLIIYLSGGQEVQVEDAHDLRVEHGEPFAGSEEPTVMCVGAAEIVLARFRADAIIGYRELPDQVHAEHIS